MSLPSATGVVPQFNWTLGLTPAEIETWGQEATLLGDQVSNYYHNVTQPYRGVWDNLKEFPWVWVAVGIMGGILTGVLVRTRGNLGYRRLCGGKRNEIHADAV